MQIQRRSSLAHGGAWSLALSLLVACSGGTDVDSGGTGGDPVGQGGSGGSGAMPGTPITGGTSSSGGMGGADSGGTDSGGSGGTPWATTPGGMAGSPPETWQEHWHDHEQNLKLVDFNEWVVLYVDDDVDRENLDWIVPTYTEVWRYVVTHYGQFTDGMRDGRIYINCHQGRYNGGHPGTYLWDRHDYRNVSDVGPSGCSEGAVGIHVHEISHVVEFASRGVEGSPAFGIWGDSKWAEFFNYDVYVGLGWTEKAEEAFNSYTAGSDDFPRPDTYWFRDWFYPLWRDHGGVQVMVNYFKQLAEHFPKNGNSYARGLNFGEYVHFMSGAVGTNLKELATDAFGWDDALEAEFTAAQSEFSGVAY